MAKIIVEGKKASQLMAFGQGTQKTVEQARAEMMAAGEAPGSERTKTANAARRSSYLEAIQQGASPDAAMKSSKAEADAILAGGKTENGRLIGSVPVTTPTNTPKPGTRVVQQVTQQVQQQPPVSQQQQQQTVAPKVERINNRLFTGEVKQVNGLWVAEITYKNGAGRESFKHKTKNGLMLAVLEGKANATVKVRQVVREQKLGSAYAQYYTFSDVTQQEFDAMPPGAQSALIDAEAGKASLRFKETVQEFYPTGENTDTLLAFLDKKRAVITYDNLVRAFEELTSAGLLDQRPEDETDETDTSIDAEDSADDSNAAPALVIAPAPAPVTPPRKRGTTGLAPGFSTGNAEALTLEENEESAEPREPSRAELNALSMKELKARSDASRAKSRQNRF